ncbi:uncharacterized protein [Dermacentor andersoni]|uniref:uncharacterized protein n=1 Tax=Dermacentor andersoni TaxID=34620 RepID=UPI003B3A22E7
MTGAEATPYDSRQRTEARLSSLLGALRCTLCASAPRQIEADSVQEEALVVRAVEGLVREVSSLASDLDSACGSRLCGTSEPLHCLYLLQEKLVAEAEQSHQEQWTLEGRLMATTVNLRQLAADKRRLNTELESLRAELAAQQVQRAEADAKLREGAYWKAKVEHLVKRLASARQRSRRLAERVATLEVHLDGAQSAAGCLYSQNTRLSAELDAVQRQKSSLEADVSAVSLQLARLAL